MHIIYIQISSGRGPVECERVVAKLTALIIQEAEQKNITTSVIDKTSGSLNSTLQSCLLQIEGDVEVVNKFAGEWEGTVQWIAQSPYRKFHKRKNWFVGVQCFTPNQTETTGGVIEYKTCRASGPGGQHVNKTESAVRATHVASGLSVLASDTRSQHQNKKLATARLQAKLLGWQMEQQMSEAQDRWLQHTDLKRGDAGKVIKASL